MSIDRAVRSLSGLNGASSSRVLNLAAISIARAGDPGHKKNPFFESPVLNSSIVLKHRLRADETDLFATSRSIGTKVIVPFEKTDLRAGGRSLFVGQRGYENLLNEVGNYRDKTSLNRDMEVLRLLDGLPSLDPFLLREQLKAADIHPDACYFAISPADQQRMFDYAAQEIRQLTGLALNRASGKRDASTAKMVEALLSNEGPERLDPIRAALRLEPDRFSEGVFSWRGFLYYKWCLQEFWPRIVKVLRDIKVIRPIGKMDAEQSKFLADIKRSLILGVKASSEEVRKVLAVYDNAYAQLIERQDPKVFREFLLDAPELFVELGEKIGLMSHVASFWQYRFPEGAPRTADVEELVTIFQDFTQSFGAQLKHAA
jgi:hypothetical protein